MSKKYFSMLFGGTLSAMVVTLLLVSDSVIAGAVIGPDAVAGVTLVSPLYSLAAFFGTVISLGVPVLYTTEMGKFNKERADRIFGLGLLMSLIVGVILFLLTGVFGEMYLRGYSPTEEILSEAKSYLTFMRFTILILPIQQLLSAAVYSDGDEAVSATSNAVQGVGNITFSVVLCHVMGIRGIGLASFIFYAVSIAILMIHFTKESNSLRLCLYFSFDILKEVIRYSIIDSSSCLFSAILTATLNAFASRLYGAEYLILVSVVTLSRNIQSLFDGVGHAITPILSVYVGEENHDGLRDGYSMANKTAIVEGIAVTLVLVGIAPFVPRVLNIVRPELILPVVTGIRLYALGSVFVSLLYLLSSYYLAIGRIALGFAACLMRDVIPGVFFAIVMGRVFGMYGMISGLTAAPAVAYILLMLYITIRYGREDCPLLLSKVPGNDRSYRFQLVAEPERIIGLQKKVEALLLENNVDSRTVGRIKLLIEELYILIWEKNGKKPVLSECIVVLLPDGIRIDTKDDGILFDISEEDVSVTSLTSFAVSAYMEQLGQNRRYLTTISFNRSSFFINTSA